MILQFLLTFYCACLLCTGKDPGHPLSGVTAAGTRVKRGTIACPPPMPMGQLVIIDGSWYTCLDRGGAIKGNKIDVFVPSHAEALRRGVRHAWVEIVR